MHRELSSLRSITAGLLIGWLTAMVIKPPKELKMHVIVATGLGELTAARKVLPELAYKHQGYCWSDA